MGDFGPLEIQKISFFCHFLSVLIMLFQILPPNHLSIPFNYPNQRLENVPQKSNLGQLVMRQFLRRVKYLTFSLIFSAITVKEWTFYVKIWKCMEICKFWHINLDCMSTGSGLNFGLKVQNFNNFQSRFSPFCKMSGIWVTVKI